MLKLSLEVLDVLVKDATAKEIDFLLFVMRFQDNTGVIKGITRAEVCRAIGIHKSKFYDIINNLNDKGIIRIFWSQKKHCFWTFEIVGNSFVEKEDYKKGYINLNTVFLWSKEFLNLTKSEKVICLKMLAQYRESKKQIVLRLKTLMEWTGRSLQSVKKYTVSIKKVFKDVSVEAGLMTIDLSSQFWLFGRNTKTETETHNEHLLEYILSVKKISGSGDNEKKDTLALFKIFGAKHGVNVIVTAIINCLDKHGKLIPKYINKLTHVICRNKNMVTLFY